MAELARRATQAAQAAPPDSPAQGGRAIPHSPGPVSALEVTVSGAELRHLAQTCVHGAESQRDQLCSMEFSVGCTSLLQVMLERLQGEAMGGTTIQSGSC